MQSVKNSIAAIIQHVSEVVMFPLGPQNRIYWLYLITSVIAAFFVYRALKSKSDHGTRRDAEAAQGSFLQFLFPKSVWSHPSAWLDLRYAFFHKLVMHSFILGLTAFSAAGGYWLTTGGQTLSLPSVGVSQAATAQPDAAVADSAIAPTVGSQFVGPAATSSQQADNMVLERSKWSEMQNWVIASVFMLIAMFLLDFIAWFIHYLQHKIPVLWQFHKVHHSSEVMHPVSNYREHPVDNLAYGAFTGLGYGVIYALAVRFLGFIPAMPTLLGIPVLMFLFNIVAYNLRHSHVWLRWPGIWSIVFPSPAHHHVHHSRHADHIDKNFAFMFPVWDLLFGTYHMPEDNRDVEFGVTEGDDKDLDSVFRLYWVPFRDAYRVLVRKKKSSVSKSEETKKKAVKETGE